jgi:hypothetical protein
MTEAEWLACTDPQAMLDFVQETGRTTDRKLRLFAGACCRHIWHLLSDEPSRRSVEIAEFFADGHADQAALLAAKSDVCAMRWGDAQNVAVFAIDLNASIAASLVMYSVANAVANVTAAEGETADAVRRAARGPLATLLRDLIGNPFRPPPRLDAAYLTPRVLSLANGIYDRRAFDHIPELAYMLQEAGCHDEDVLDHLRRPGPHARGCHVLDAVLGRS